MATDSTRPANAPRRTPADTNAKAAPSDTAELDLYRGMTGCGVFSVGLAEGYPLLYANDRCFELFDTTAEAVNADGGYHSGQFIVPGELDEAKKLLRTAAESGSPGARLTIRIRTAKGREKFVLINGNFDRSDGIGTFSGTLVDITGEKRAEIDLLVEKTFTDIALEATGLAIWKFDFATKSMHFSPHAPSLQKTGFPAIVEDVPEALIASGHILPESAGAFREMYEKLFDGAKTAEGVFHVRGQAGGADRYERIRYTSLFDDAGKPYLAVGVSEDVTDAHETRRKFERESQLFEVISADVLGTALIDATLWKLIQYQYHDPSFFVDVSTADELFAHAVNCVVDSPETKRILESIKPATLAEHFADGQNAFSFEYRRKNAAGEVVWVRDETHLVKDPDTGRLMMFIWLRNIDTDRARYAELSRAAETDSMTGLLNHDATFAHIDRFLRREGLGGYHALFMVDIDNFKEVNDRFGHRRGDEIIADVAKAVRSVFRSDDIVGRIGGDEFLALMKNVSDPALISKRASELVTALEFTFSDGGGTFAISASVGVSCYRANDVPAEKLSRLADAALYEAKRAGKRCFVLSEGGGVRTVDAGTDAGNAVQLKTLLEYMDGGVLIAEVTDEIRITYVSPSFYKTMGRSPSEYGLGGKALFSLVLSDDLPALQRALFACAENGTLIDHAYRVSQPDGVGVRHLRAVRLPSENDGVRRLIGVITDITELKRSTENFEAIVESVPGGIGILQPEGDKLTPVFSNTLLSAGIAAVPAAADDLLLLVDPDDRADVLKEIKDSFAENRALNVLYRSVPRADGTIRYMNARGVWILNSGEKPQILAIMSDNTREKRMSDQLRFAELRYRTAVEQGDILMWEVDIPKRTVIHRGSIADKLGYTGKIFQNAPESLIAAGVIREDSVSRCRKMFNDIYAGHESRDYVICSVAPDGSSMWTSGRYSLLSGDDGLPNYAIGVATSMPNIEADIHRFEQEKQFLSFITPTLLGTACSNLSRNNMESIADDLALATKSDVLSTYDAFAARSASLVVQEDRAQFEKDVSRESLLKHYRSGNHWRYLEYRRINSRGEPRYVSLILCLLRHPISGNVHAFSYLRDVDTSYRWSHALGKPLHHDSATLLYSRETLSELVSSILKSSEAGAHCALTAFAFSGIDKIRAEQGAHVENDVLFSIGRLCRFAATGNVIAGHLDSTHIALFRTDVISVTEHQAFADQFRARIETSLKLSFPSLEIGLVCGFSIEKASETSFGELEKKTLIACETAAHFTGQAVVSYADSGISPDAAASAAHAAVQDSLPLVLLASPCAETRSALREILESRYRILEADAAASVQTLLSGGAVPAALIVDSLLTAAGGQSFIAHLSADPLTRAIPILAISSGDADAYGKALENGAFDAIARPFIPTVAVTRVAGVISRGDYARVYAQNRSYELRFQHQENLLRLAEFDSLSGIYNKHTFCTRVRQILNANPGREYVIFRLDLDNFKVFNDTLGVPAGDRLLSDIGGALRRRVTPGNVYARFDADHFVLFLPADTDARMIYDETISWLSAYPADFKLTCRIGVYSVVDPSVDISIMCDRALLAVRSIKGNFQKRIAYYDDSLRNRLVEEQQLIGEVVDALDGKQFEVYFQPQINYDSGAIIGAEALVRWNHPTLGLLPPGRFIPLFEKNGFISELDAYVWEQSCHAMRRWLDSGGRLVPVSVAVNISRLDIYNPHLCDNLRALTEKYSLPPSLLKLEITESAYIENPQQLVGVVNGLRAMGFTVEMDDFGSGYSSLNTLKDVPVDTLKLDMKFLTECLDSTRGGSILSSVVRMAHWLKLPVIAEGVETKEQADYLKSLGCYFMQGYYFGKPMPAAEFEKLLLSEKLAAIDRFSETVLDGKDFFWDASRETTMLFNCLPSGAAVVEYRRANAEILRTNDQFYSVINASREGFRPFLTRLADRFSGVNRESFTGMLNEAVATGAAECTVTADADASLGASSPVRIRARVLASSSEGYILFLSLDSL